VKRCARCGETKPLSDFHTHKTRRDGVQTYCKPCRAEIDHERYQRLRGTRVPSRVWERGRHDWLLSLKSGKPCTDCGRIFPPEVMQWDHVPGAPKLGNMSTDFRGRSREEILDEIAKCELVCANCHAIRTFDRAGWGGWSGRAYEAGQNDPTTTTPSVRVGSEEMAIRQCVMCGMWKGPNEFHDSRTGQFSYCRDCRRAYDRRYYHERGKEARQARKRSRTIEERAWMAALKDGVPCTDCHRTFPAWVMHWDHLPGYEKLGCISQMVGSRSRAITIAELKKCELVCANCHVLRTINRARERAARESSAEANEGN
jgi:hypothetical protein